MQKTRRMVFVGDFLLKLCFRYSFKLILSCLGTKKSATFLCESYQTCGFSTISGSIKNFDTAHVESDEFLGIYRLWVPWKLENRGFARKPNLCILSYFRDVVTVVWRVFGGRCLKQCAHFFADVFS